MADNKKTGTFGLILSAIVAVVAVVFVMQGGSKTTVETEQDFPALADPDKPADTR
jgi:hypothetical protein